MSYEWNGVRSPTHKMPPKLRGVALVHPTRKNETGKRFDARLGPDEYDDFVNAVQKHGLALCDDHDWSKSFGRAQNFFHDADGIKCEFELPIVCASSKKLAESILDRKRAGISLGTLVEREDNGVFDMCAAIRPVEVSFCEEGQMEGARVLKASLLDDTGNVLEQRVLASKTVASLSEEREAIRYKISLVRVMASESVPPAAQPAAAATPTPTPTATTTPPVAEQTQQPPVAEQTQQTQQPVPQISPELLASIVPPGVDPNKFFVEKMAEHQRMKQEEERRAAEQKELERKQNEQEFLKMQQTYAHLLSDEKHPEFPKYKRDLDRMNAIAKSIMQGTPLSPADQMEAMKIQTDLAAGAMKMAAVAASKAINQNGFTGYNADSAAINQQRAKQLGEDFWKSFSPEVRASFEQAGRHGATPAQAAAFAASTIATTTATTTPAAPAPAPAALKIPNETGGHDVLTPQPQPQQSAPQAQPQSVMASKSFGGSGSGSGVPRLEREQPPEVYHREPRFPRGAGCIAKLRAGDYSIGNPERPSPKFAVLASGSVHNNNRDTAPRPGEDRVVITPELQAVLASIPVSTEGRNPSPLTHPMYVFAKPLVDQCPAMGDALRFGARRQDSSFLYVMSPSTKAQIMQRHTAVGASRSLATQRQEQQQQSRQRSSNPNFDPMRLYGPLQDPTPGKYPPAFEDPYLIPVNGREQMSDF